MMDLAAAVAAARRPRILMASEMLKTGGVPSMSMPSRVAGGGVVAVVPFLEVVEVDYSG